MKPIPEEMTIVQCIPIGTKMGVFAINNLVMFNNSPPSEKDKIEEEYMKIMRGDLKTI